MSEALTVWFPAEIKPSRKGVYMTRLEFQNGEFFKSVEYSYWDGGRWCDSAKTIKCAFDKRNTKVPYRKMWRGLAKPARATGKGE